MLSLGIDGGASSAKWVVIDQSRAVVQRGVSSAIDGHLYRPDSCERFNLFLNEIKSVVGDLLIDAVTIGITGYGASDSIHACISKIFPEANIEASTDIALAYRGEFAVGEGIFLYAGTGSVAIHISADQQEMTAGGWGYLLGDEGGGYWIGREALRYLAKRAESGSHLDDLALEIARVIGGPKWSDIRAFTYSSNRSEIAQLSRNVVSLAESNIPAASEILNEAARHLADLVLNLDRRLNGNLLPVIFGGGMSNAIPSMRANIESLLGRPLKLGAADYAFTAAELGLTKGKISFPG